MKGGDLELNDIGSTGSGAGNPMHDGGKGFGHSNSDTISLTGGGNVKRGLSCNCCTLIWGLTMVFGVVIIALGQALGKGMIPAAYDPMVLMDTGLKDIQSGFFVCLNHEAGSSKTNEGWEAFQNVDFLEGTADPARENKPDEMAVKAYDIYYLYHITNPSAHLLGSVAEVVEVGPFVMRSFDEYFDMEIGEEGYLSYKSGSVHVFLDEVQVVTGPGKDDTIVTLKESDMTPMGVTRQTPIANFNQGYLNVLGSAGQEYALFLKGAGCSTQQIKNIADSTKIPCTNAELAAGADTCSCCTLPDQVNLQDFTGLLMEKSICDGLSANLDAFTLTTAKDGMRASFEANGVPGSVDGTTFTGYPTEQQNTIIEGALIASTGVAEPTDEQKLAAAVALVLDGAGYEGMRTSFEAGGVPGSDPAVDAAEFTALSKDDQDTIIDGVIVIQAKAGITASFAVNGVPDGSGGLAYTAAAFNALVDSTTTTQAQVVDGAYADAATKAAADHGVKRGAVAIGLNMTPEQGGMSAGLDVNAATDAEVFSFILLSKGAQYCECKSGGTVPEGATGCCLKGGMIPNMADMTYAGGTDLANFFCNNELSVTDDGAVTTDTVGTDTIEFPYTNGYYYASVAVTAAGQMAGVVPPNRNCVNMLNENAGIMSLVNFLSGIDGGADVTAAKNRDGTDFAGDKFGNPKTWSPLIQTHSANDHLYGYPSALLGAMVPMLVLELPGKPMAYKQGNLTRIGAYTAGFQAVCESTCTDPAGTSYAAAPGGYKCAGTAPDRVTLSNINKEAIMFADNDCAPLSWTYSTKFFCGAIEAGVATAVYEKCKTGFDVAFSADSIYNTKTDEEKDTLIEDAILAAAGSADAKTSYCTTTVLAGAGYQGMFTQFAAHGICADYNDAGTCSMDAATFAGLDAAAQKTTVDGVIAAGIAAGIKVSFAENGVPNADGSPGYAYTADVFNTLDTATQDAVVDGAYNALAAADPRTTMDGYENEAKLGAVATGLGVTAKADGTTLWAGAANQAALVEAYANSLGTEYCTCYDGAHGFANMPAKGCCLAGGNTGPSGGDQDLTGFGCLYGHPGHYVSRVGGEGSSSKDLAESMTRAKAAANTAQSDGSPAVSSMQDWCPVEGKLLANQIEYEDKTSYPASRSGATQPVQGGNGMFFEPQGLTGALGDSQITAPGTNIGDTASIYVSQVKRELTTEYVGDDEYLGLNVAKYGANPKLLWATADGGFEKDSASVDVGKMAPGTCGKVDASAPCEGFNGAQHAGVASGTGLPVYLIQPNFFNADPELLDSAINDVKLYHCYDYLAKATYDGFSELPAVHTDDVWDLKKCELIDAAFLEAHKDDLDTYILVEPATGMAISGHSRLSLAVSPVTDCNIMTDASCALGITATGVLGSCHSAVATGFWSAITLPTTLTADATFKMMYQIYPDASYAPGSPCSQANVLTPAYKGGNLMPLWWLDQAADATQAKLDTTLVLVNKMLELMGTISKAGTAGGAVMTLIGGACIAFGRRR